MAGNAHASRHRRSLRGKTDTGCKFCSLRPKAAKAKRFYHNHNGHRHNPAANKKQ